MLKWSTRALSDKSRSLTVITKKEGPNEWNRFFCDNGQREEGADEFQLHHQLW